MVQIAFYAPLKSPSSPTPSGDRQVAQLLIQALEFRGHQVELASSLRSWEGNGDAIRQQYLKVIAQRIAQRLINKYRQTADFLRPRVWFTYHVYHKAPDWIGPAVSRALDIPYVIAEASYAPKQAQGLWREGHEQTAACIAHADTIFNLNNRDIECVQPLLAHPDRLVHLRPFLAEQSAMEKDTHSRPSLAQTWQLDPNKLWLISVAMMRVGDKFSSYRILSEALNCLNASNWQLIIVGEGRAREQVHQLFSRYTGTQVRFVGRLLPPQLFALLGHSDLFVWPAINEAYGMALLEAQACGLPVVAGKSGGVADLVAHTQTGLLSDAGDTEAFAGHIDQLLTDIGQRKQMGKSAREKFKRYHTLSNAATRIGQTIDALLQYPNP